MRIESYCKDNNCLHNNNTKIDFLDSKIAQIDVNRVENNI